MEKVKIQFLWEKKTEKETHIESQSAPQMILAIIDIVADHAVVEGFADDFVVIVVVFFLLASYQVFIVIIIWKDFGFFFLFKSLQSRTTDCLL